MEGIVNQETSNSLLMSEIIADLSLVLALYAFVAALLLFVAQTENYNRVAYYWKKKGNHAWMALFNTSRRFLVADDIPVPMHFDGIGLNIRKDMDNGLKTFGEVKGAKASLVDGQVQVDFDYMGPRTSMVVNLDVVGKADDPDLQGVIRGGRLVWCHFLFDDITHSILANVLAYTTVFILSLGSFLLLKSRGLFSCADVWIFSVALLILLVGLYCFFLFHRRIYFGKYHEVKKYIKSGF